MNFYPHHIGDFNNDTRHLTRIERSIYRDLIELYYDTECPLIPDKDKLSRLVLASSQDELTAVEQVLNEFFDYTNNGYFHSRCHEIICDYKKNIKGKSKAGIASAKARKARKLKALHELTDVEQVLNTCTTDVRNQKPETRNHKPIVKTKEKIVIPDGINIDSWTEWIEARKANKKKVSEAAAKKQFKLLLKYTEKEQKLIIDKSIQNDYQGLFELKGNGNGNYQANKRQNEIDDTSTDWADGLFAS